MVNTAISVKNVNKSFKLPHQKHSSLKGLFVNLLKGSRTFEKQTVLNDINFEVNEGEFLGIVGRNGSGKSTLLKLLAGIYVPNKGSISVTGKLTPFIELGVGFNPELTGRENVFLNGALLGFDRKEMIAMYDEIVNFAELEKFMDQKLKNYSSGMQVRLAFSIAIRARSDILLIDEVLAVGDMDFQKKCFDYFIDIKKQKQTVILVTHDMSAVRKFCDRCVLIQDGKVIIDGDPESAAELYESLNLRAAEVRLDRVNSKDKSILQDGEGGAEIAEVLTFDPETGKKQNTFTPSEKLGFRITYKITSEMIKQPSISFIFQDQSDSTVFATNNHILKLKTKTVHQGDLIIMETVVDNVFTDGTYKMTVAIESNDFSKVYDRIKNIHSFQTGGHSLPHATTHPFTNMKIEYK